MEKEKQPIFEEFPTVDCNECEHHWTNTCDGTPVGSDRLCKTFKAIRQTDIPLQIQMLWKASKRLTRGLLMISAAEICLAIAFLLLYLRLT